jgi:hypothetical protein
VLLSICESSKNEMSLIGQDCSCDTQMVVSAVVLSEHLRKSSGQLLLESGRTEFSKFRVPFSPQIYFLKHLFIQLDQLVE